jgi:hypothetical protein
METIKESANDHLKIINVTYKFFLSIIFIKLGIKRDKLINSLF